MAEEVLKLTFAEPARFQISTLGPEDGRLISNWLESIRRWHSDDFARTRSVRLRPDEELYMFSTDVSDLMIAFRLTDTEVVVEAIVNKHLVKMFERAAQGSGV